MTLSILGLQPHAQRIESGPLPCTAEARKQDVQQVHWQSAAGQLHAVALTQSLRQQDSPRRGHSHRNANAKQSKDAEFSGPHIAHRQSAAAPQETESLRLFLSGRSRSLRGLKNSKMAAIVVLNSEPLWSCFFHVKCVRDTCIVISFSLFCTNKQIVNYANNRSLVKLCLVLSFSYFMCPNWHWMQWWSISVANF